MDTKGKAVFRHWVIIVVAVKDEPYGQSNKTEKILLTNEKRLCHSSLKKGRLLGDTNRRCEIIKG